MNDAQAFLANVRKALGRRETVVPPAPPALNERLIRTLPPDANLPRRFATQARASGMEVTVVELDQLADRLIGLLRDSGCNRVALPVSPVLDAMDLVKQLRDAGFDAHRWKDLTPDALFDFDCGVTDCHAAIAETGSIVLKAQPTHGRVLSLVPAIHIAIVQPRQILPDLLDALRQLESDGVGSGAVVITGPSKTTDIEGNLVIGVHGPGRVHVLLLE